MSLRKKDFVVDCEHCVFGMSDGVGSFNVTVPLRDNASDIKGMARLKCSVSPDRHEVELKQWLDDGLRPIQPSASVEKRLLQMLDFVANKRICGNRHLCPPEVVRTVEQESRR